MGLGFLEWIDHDGDAFSIASLEELAHFEDFGVRKS